MKLRARAAGGYLIHIVETDAGAALCGHRPRHSATNMRRRARWLVVSDSNEITCETCKEKNLKAQLEMKP